MDKTSFKMLGLLKTHSSLNYDQFYVLLGSIDLSNYSERISYLLDESFIEKSDQFLSEEERNTTTFSINTRFKITLKGTQYLENKKSESRKFKIQSVYIPVFVALLTSIITSLVTVWITK